MSIFSKNNNSESSTNNIEITPSNASTSCVLTKGTVVDGTIRSKENFRLDGIVKGDVICDKRFVMGDTGVVEGTVSCEESSISGRIEGVLSVKGLLHLLQNCFIKGKINANKMIVDEGAKYAGECKIGAE